MKSTGVKFAIRELFEYADCRSLEIVTPEAEIYLFQTDYFNVNEAAGVLIIQNEIKTAFIDLENIQYIRCNTKGCKRKFADRHTKGLTFRGTIRHEENR